MKTYHVESNPPRSRRGPTAGYEITTRDREAAMAQVRRFVARECPPYRPGSCGRMFGGDRMKRTLAIEPEPGQMLAHLGVEALIARTIEHDTPDGALEQLLDMRAQRQEEQARVVFFAALSDFQAAILAIAKCQTTLANACVILRRVHHAAGHLESPTLHVPAAPETAP